MSPLAPDLDDLWQSFRWCGSIGIGCHDTGSDDLYIYCGMVEFSVTWYDFLFYCILSLKIALVICMLKVASTIDSN